MEDAVREQACSLEEDMSLLTTNMQRCVMVRETAVSDGRGGQTIPAWVDGAEFLAAVMLDNSMEARRAQAQGVTGVYTVTVSRSENLQYHDVFRRVSDGKVFRVTSDGDDKKTPKTAGLDMRQVSAEEWQIPMEEEARTGG